MKYTVVTTALAHEQLTAIWLNAANRQDVTNASDRIDFLLKHDAQCAIVCIQTAGACLRSLL